MPVNTKEVDTRNYKRARRRYAHCTKQWSMKGPEALLSLYETMTIYKGPEGAVIIVQDNDHL